MLNTKIIELKKLLMAEASLVEKMVSMAFMGLNNDTKHCFDDVLVFEKRVNQLDVEISGKCTTAIALHQPAAKDLRTILMIYMINNDLERLGDQAVNIAESVVNLAFNPISDQMAEIEAMKESALKMLKESLDAFTNEDTELAQKVCEDDNIVDDYERSIVNELIKLMKANPQHLEEYLHLLRIASNLERIADLSTNIAESTIYFVDGIVIKHHQHDDQ